MKALLTVGGTLLAIAGGAYWFLTKKKAAQPAMGCLESKPAEDVATKAPAAKKAIAQRRKLYACLALLVISGAGVQIYMRRALAALHNYSYFVFQSGAIAYFPIVLAVTLFKFMFTYAGHIFIDDEIVFVDRTE